MNPTGQTSQRKTSGRIGGHAYSSGLDVENKISSPVEAELFFLTSLFIELIEGLADLGSMHYERAALVEWSIGRGCRERIRGEDRQIG